MTLTMVVVVVGKLVENVLDRVPDVDVDVDVDVDRVPDGAELVDSQSSGLELQLADRSVSPIATLLRSFHSFL